MGRHTGRRRTVLERVDFVSFFVGASHRRFDTAIGQESAQDNVFGTLLPQQEIQIGRFKTAQTRFALDDQIARLRFHGLCKLRPPLAVGKGRAILDTRQDTVGLRTDFGMTRLEIDGAMNDGASFGSGKFGEFRSILKHFSFPPRSYIDETTQEEAEGQTKPEC